MLGPYRDPVPACVELLPDTCVPEDAPGSCCPALASHRAAPQASPPATAPLHLRLLTAAATLLLLVGSASLSAITWTVTSTLLAARTASVVEPQQVVQMAAPAPRSGAPWGFPHPVTGLGTDTHDVDALWSRAEWRAASHAQITLARAMVAPDALAGAIGSARIVGDRRGGLGVVDLDPSSPAALLGLRRGDRITAVNGFPLRRPEDAKRAWTAVAAGRGAVMELERAGHAVALRIDWAS
jgi:membrane-associated protease RseP (regulator of RpoE activity)